MKKYNLLYLIGLTSLLLALSACTPTIANPDYPSVGLANPASTYCIEQGGTLDIRTSDNGDQTGYCVFENGNECEEWAYYRHECTPDQLTQNDPLQNTAWQWIQYTNNETGEQLEIPTPQNFTLNFSKENQLGLNADCNLVSGTYQLTDHNALTITLGITTEAYCGDDSLDTLYKNALLNSASYIILEDQLLLTLKDDLGQLTFTAAPTK